VLILAGQKELIQKETTMPWDKNNYPDSMKNLDKDVREKAIETANALLDDGMKEGRAIAIAISQAKNSG